MKPAWQLSAAELGAAFRRRDSDPATHLAQVLERIERLNAKLNAIIAMAPDLQAQARSSAERYARARPLSLIDGVPIVVKDNILAADLPCVWGSRVYESFVPAENEMPVERLRAAGALIVGKTNVPELTFEGITWNPVFGATRNPYDLDLTPGGSSGGSVAAVAAGLVPLALGTDGGGSIRRPASHTGLVGLKPSIGAVPRVHSLPMMLLDLEVIGPIARTVEDVRLVFDVIAGPHRRERRSFLPPAAKPAEPLRVLHVPRFGDAPVDAEIAASVDGAAQALAALGCKVETGSLPLDLGPLNAFWPRFGAAGVAYVMSLHPGKEHLLGPRFQTMLEQGRTVSGAEYLAGVELFERLRRESDAVFDRWDLIMTPSAAALPWAAEKTHPETIDGRPVGPRGHAVYTGWVNACGIPAINLPCAPSKRGLPIGYQLVARYGADRMLLDLAARVEAFAPWRDRWPSI